MAKFKERGIALQLRQQGMSYSQIKERVTVSKSTLSYWLRDYPLSRERINELRAWSERRIEKFRETFRHKREVRLASTYELQKQSILPLNRKEMFIAGLFLYAGEGSKTRINQVALSNSNPAIIHFFLHWLTEILNVSKEKIKIRLHLYRDMDVKEEKQYWVDVLDLGSEHFKNPYIKSSSKKRINYRGGFGHGTCNVVIGDSKLFEKIMMSIKAIMDHAVGA